MGKCGAGSVAAKRAEICAGSGAAEESKSTTRTRRGCPWVDDDERGAGASAKPSMVNSQFESVDGTVGPVGSCANTRFVGD